MTVARNMGCPDCTPQGGQKDRREEREERQLASERERTAGGRAF